MASSPNPANLFFGSCDGATFREIPADELVCPAAGSGSSFPFDSPQSSCRSPTALDFAFIPSPGISPWVAPAESPKNSTPSESNTPGLEHLLLLRRTAFTPTTQPSDLQWREATASDVTQITDLTNALDMSYATSFVWGEREMRRRILTRSPLTIVAVEGNVVVGVAGIDVAGIEKPFHVHSIGSRVTNTPANERFTIPEGYCLCRGLLVHPNHQGKGIASLLHRGRLQCLHSLVPDTPGVVLSARGSSLEEALAILGPRLNSDDPSDLTPQFSKSEIFEFTFKTSLGVVHLAHGKDDQGWRFVGVDESDGGPVWCTSDSLSNIVRACKVAAYKKKLPPTKLTPPPDLGLPIFNPRRPAARQNTLPLGYQIPEALMSLEASPSSSTSNGSDPSSTNTGVQLLESTTKDYWQDSPVDESAADESFPRG